MLAKQLTVFVENRIGRLREVLNVLKENGVSILSMSLADTTEFGLLRLIVDNPEIGKEKLVENGFTSLLTDVSIIKIAHKVGSLQNLLTAIEDGGVNIEYMYGLSIEAEEAYVVLKASDATKIEEIFQAHEIETITGDHLLEK